jgi:hypothetical protein
LRQKASTLARDGGGQVGLGQVIGHDQGVEAGLVDRVERDLVDVGPVLQIAAGGVEELAVAGQAVGDREVEDDRLVFAGLEADLANALAGQGALGVGVRDRAGRPVERSRSRATRSSRRGRG